MEGPKQHDDEWPVTGEVPSHDADWMVEPSQEQFEKTAQNLAGTSLNSDHEVVTHIDKKLITVLSEHKKEVAVGVLAGLSVAAVLAATHQLRIRSKK